MCIRDSYHSVPKEFLMRESLWYFIFLSKMKYITRQVKFWEVAIIIELSVSNRNLEEIKNCWLKHELNQKFPFSFVGNPLNLYILLPVGRVLSFLIYANSCSQHYCIWGKKNMVLILVVRKIWNNLSLRTIDKRHFSGVCFMFLHFSFSGPLSMAGFFIQLGSSQMELLPQL